MSMRMVTWLAIAGLAWTLVAQPVRACSYANEYLGANPPSESTLPSGEVWRFHRSGLADPERLAAPPDDEFDRWARERDLRVDRSASARYLSPDVIGYEELDAEGDWRTDARYGSVWTPRRVAAGWSPYRDGHWAWVAPWGWTWVDDAPWGFAVSHYGRWARVDERWSWVPGPRQERAVYAPALVAFVGLGALRASVTLPGLVAWIPLAPAEVFRPAYRVGPAYFDRINRSNAVIAPTVIHNVYNTYNTTIVNPTTVVNQNRRDTVVNPLSPARSCTRCPSWSFAGRRGRAAFASARPVGRRSCDRPAGPSSDRRPTPTWIAIASRSLPRCRTDRP